MRQPGSGPQPESGRSYVLDTSVLLSDPGALGRFDEHEVVLPLVVIGELEGKLGLKLVPGAIIKFDKTCDQPLELCIGDQPIATVEVVKNGEKIGLIGLTPVDTPELAVQNLEDRIALVLAEPARAWRARRIARRPRRRGAPINARPADADPRPPVLQPDVLFDPRLRAT